MNALRRAAQRALFTGERHGLAGSARAFAAKANACPHDPTKPYHKSPLPLETAGGLLEYSVVYTDRAMNHMSKPFCKVRPGARRCANARASRRRARACPNSFPRKWQPRQHPPDLACFACRPIPPAP